MKESMRVSPGLSAALLVAILSVLSTGSTAYKAIASAQFDPTILQVKKLKDATISDLTPLRQRFEFLLEKKIRFDLSSAGLLSEVVYCPSWFPGSNTSAATMDER